MCVCVCVYVCMCVCVYVRVRVFVWVELGTCIGYLAHLPEQCMSYRGQAQREIFGIQ